MKRYKTTVSGIADRKVYANSEDAAVMKAAVTYGSNGADTADANKPTDVVVDHGDHQNHWKVHAKGTEFRTRQVKRTNKQTPQERLYAVRDYIAELPPYDASSVDGEIQDLSRRIEHKDAPVPKPERLNMSTMLATHADKDGSWHCVGCIAGVTMALFPEEVRATIREHDAKYSNGGNQHYSADKTSAVGSVLGLDERTGECLLFGLGSPHYGDLGKMTTDEVTTAITRAANGIRGEKLWAPHEAENSDS